MASWVRRFGALTTVVLASFGFASDAVARQPSALGGFVSVTAETPLVGACPDEPDHYIRAERLYAEAHALLNRGADWVRAARLLERSAALRPDCDRRVFESLRLASRLYQYGERPDLARLTLLRAAEHGVWTGNVLAAAHAFIDAATLAVEIGDRGAASDAAEKAELLSSSPLLSPTQKLSITGRISTVEQLRIEGR